MTRRRWIADEWSGDRASLLGRHAEHLSRVLRVKAGQQFEVSVGGEVRLGRVVHVNPDRVDFDLGEFVSGATLVNISVALALFKFDRYEWAIEKLTELGVVAIIPFAAGRSDSHLVAAAEKRLERWRRVGMSAAEQSRRASPPEICSIHNLRDVLSFDGLRIVLSEAAPPEKSLISVLREASQRSEKRTVVLAFGPEGGWTEDELSSFIHAGWIEASLGPNILRAETAAIAAVAIAASMLNAQADEND